jgi:periplasmic protein TonB
MRTWTLVVSVCAHAVAIGAVIVAPIFATTDLPDPRRPLTFEAIIPIETPVVPVAPRPQTTPQATATQTIPIIEPIDLSPDTPPAPPSPPLDIVADGGTGVPTNGFLPAGDPVIAPPPPPPARKEPMPVGGVIRPPARVTYVQPVYPPLAIAARKEGIVILQAVIDERGKVREVKVLSSIPLLDDAAVRAVSQWTFTPTLLNGMPVAVSMTVTVGFQLQK